MSYLIPDQFLPIITQFPELVGLDKVDVILRCIYCYVRHVRVLSHGKKPRRLHIFGDNAYGPDYGVSPHEHIHFPTNLVKYVNCDEVYDTVTKEKLYKVLKKFKELNEHCGCSPFTYNLDMEVAITSKHAMSTRGKRFYGDLTITRRTLVNCPATHTPKLKRTHLMLSQTVNGVTETIRSSSLPPPVKRFKSY